MSDNPQGTTPAESPDKANGKTPLESLPADVQEYIRELRRENEKRRKTEDDIRTAAEEQNRKADEARLAEQQKWQELAEKRGKEVDTLKPLQERYKALEAAFVATLDKRIEAVPDAYKSALELIDDPVKKMQWLDANAHLFTQRQAPRLDAGAQGDANLKSTIKLTPEQRQTARKFNLTDDQYAAQLAKIEAQRSAPTQE